MKRIFSLHGNRGRPEEENSRDLTHEILWPGSVQNRTLPNFRQSDARVFAKFFAREGTYTMPPGGLIRCPGFIVGESAAVVSRGGALLKEPSRQIAKDIFQHPVVRRHALRPERKLKRVFFASFDQGSTFYHWLLDILPLLLVPDFRQHLTPDTTVVCPPILHPYQRESLALAQLENLDLLPTTSFSCIEAGEILVPVLPQTTGHQHHISIETLRRTFLAQGKSSPRVASKDIFISRRKALRGLANEEEILNILKPAGFEAAVLEDMTLAEQIDLFAGSRRVVAPHGAGLSHIVFMPAGSQVIEFFSSAFINPCYWRLACAVGLDYKLCLGSPARQSMRPEHDSYQIQIKDLVSALEQWES